MMLSKPSAEIIPFAPSAVSLNRLTVTDRIYAHEWGTSHAAPVGARITIHMRRHDDAPEVSDYIGLYRAQDSWAVWHLARDAGMIIVWNGPTGADLGVFNTMREALMAIPIHSMMPRTGRRPENNAAIVEEAYASQIVPRAIVTRRG